MNHKYENVLSNYVNSGPPDKAELASLLLKAKGVRRNMAEFAEECDISASTFSRIANCKITQPVATDLLVKISEHADPEAGIDIRKLLLANGMTTKENDVINKRREAYLGTSNPYEQAIAIKNLIVNDLIDRGNGIKLQQQIDDPDASRFVRTSGKTSFILSAQDGETAYWKFRMVGLQGYSIAGGSVSRVMDTVYRERRRNYKSEATMLLSRLAEVFLEDVWNPEKLRMCKMSFVFRDAEYYEAFNELVKGKKFNNWFSTILIDEDKGHVVEEYAFERHDGVVKKSPLDYPLLTESDDSEDESFYEEGVYDENE